MKSFEWRTTMPRGGARPGAGRKPKSPADGAAAIKKQIDGAEISGDSPVDFLLEVMKSEKLPLPVRMQAAAILAPFLHAKPAAIGKKEQQADDAAGAAGKFGAAAEPPKLVAAGGKKL